MAIKAWAEVTITILKDAPTIAGTVVRYQISNDGDNVPEGLWYTEKPTVPDGSYLWIYTNVVYSDGTQLPTYSVSKIGLDAVTDDLDALASIVSSISADLNYKAGLDEFEAMQVAFNARVEQDIQDKARLSTDLSTMTGRMALVETIAGNNKLITEFVDNVITQSDEGIYISNGASSTGILISENRISFMDNNVEVAYISNQTMQINHGIFVESATISDFKFEKIPGTTILAITWVGD